MKHMLYLAAFALLLSCSKSKTQINETLLGKWQLAINAFSIGGPIEEHQADPSKPVIVEFKKDGTYTNSTGGAYTQYSLNGNRVKLTGPGATTVTLQFTIAGDTLTLTPIEPMCIEGCYTKYTAVN